MKHFIVKKTIKELVIEFGEYIAVYTKPLPKTKIETLSFAYISNDLYKIEEFVTQTMGFGTVQMGNRSFKLFENIDDCELRGLKLIGGTMTDQANLRTLVVMLKKTNTLRIDRLDVCWPVLKILADNPAEFSNITGLELLYDPKHSEIVATMAEKYGHKLKHLSLGEAIVKYPNPNGFLKATQ